jgi:hypothetical protein
MVAAVENKLSKLNELCGRYRVERLELFGSAATGEFRPGASDLDFLVRFMPRQSDRPDEHFDRYFGLLEDLKTLFGTEIDLLEEHCVRNPYLLRSINESRTTVYGPSHVEQN